MTIHRRTFRTLAISTVLAAFPFHPVLAQDAAAIAEGLKSAAARQGIDLNWAGVTGDASELVLEDVTVKPSSEDEARKTAFSSWRMLPGQS